MKQNQLKKCEENLNNEVICIEWSYELHRIPTYHLFGSEFNSNRTEKAKKKKLYGIGSRE